MDSPSTGAAPGPPGTTDLAAVERAIGALEAQRDLLGDEVVDTALLPLQERRRTLVDRTHGEQRRLVTVVFADLVGFTDLSGGLDAEDTRTIVDRYFSRWLHAIEEHGGVVEKFIGDAVMAVFGLRQSWEDDAERACRAALSMVADLDDLNAGLEQEYGVRLRMRVGVDTGDVVVSTLGDRGGAEFVVVGQTVNRASRLESNAPPDGILVSAETHRQIRGRFNMERRDGLVLKGIEQPVTAYLVLSERPRGFRLDRSGGVEGVETSTVGREIELRFLQERLWDVMEESHARVVTVVGDAGVGKTRLLLEFDSWLAERPQPVWWFRGRASHTSQNRANALLRDVVTSRFGIAESDEPAQVGEKLRSGLSAVFGQPGEADRVARLLADWLGLDVGETARESTAGLDPQALRDRAGEALATYFAALAKTAPVVVLLEDLHWADDASLRWIDAGGPELARSRVLVVATARPALLDERPHWGEGLGYHVRLPLDALSRRESRQLLHQLLQRVESPPEDLVELVISSTEGNPFYIEELVTWMVDAGVIVKDETSWRVERDLIGSVVVPSTLRGVLQARLDALSGAERGLLQRASVVGRVFWDDAVDRLTERRDGPPAADTLDHLRRRDLVFEREVSSFGSAREFLFKHALLRDVAYDGVLRAHRQRYHARTAAWLADVSERSGREDEYAALVAEHYDRAGDPAAGRWYFRAGEQALAVYALTEASRLLQRALELVTDDPALRADVLLARESMLDRIGDRDAQRADLADLHVLVSVLGDETRTARFELARCRLAFVLSEYDDAERWARHAADSATLAGSPAVRAEALLWRGKSLVWRDAIEKSRAMLLDALGEARILSLARVEAEALRYLSMLANNEGDYPTALELVEKSREAFASVGDAEGEGTALGQQATSLFHMGRPAEARACLEEVLPLFRRSGHRYREALVLGNLGVIADAQGELAEARGRLVEAQAVMRELQDREAVSTNDCVLAHIATTIGEWAAAEEHLEEAVRLAREVGAIALETDALTKRALLLLERGAVDQARPAALEALRVGETTPSAMERGVAQLACGYVQLAAGAPDDADQAFDAAADSFAGLGVDHLRREALTGRAAVLHARGRDLDAVPLVEEVLPHLTREGLEGSSRPTAVLATCVDVLTSAGHPGAGDVLSAAQAWLEEAADRIGDPEMAAAFRSVPANTHLRERVRR